VAKPSLSYAGDPKLCALGSVIRARRMELEMSQEALASNSGVDRSYMGGLERGEHNPTLMTLIRVASALGTPASELLKSADI